MHTETGIKSDMEIEKNSVERKRERQRLSNKERERGVAEKRATRLKSTGKCFSPR
jgi:hypothetical protein